MVIIMTTKSLVRNVFVKQRRMISLRGFTSSSSSSYAAAKQKIVDLRSDTVTLPSKEMLQCVSGASLGDDVMGEDPTVQELEHTVADMFGKQRGLFVPTGTMANLVSLMSHCNDAGRAPEIILGSGSHINLWEGGNASSLGGIYVRQINEHPHTAELDRSDVQDCVRRSDQDDHWPTTALLCLENTHNMCGGVALSKDYMDRMSAVAHLNGIKVHVDGARIFNAAIAQGISVERLCSKVDSVSVCLSKGLGAPVGSVLVGSDDFIRVVKSARKRCGGGMRQAGVIASMGLYAIRNNIDRLVKDHGRAKKIGRALTECGCYIPRDGQIDTNIVYFALPETTCINRDEFVERLNKEYGVKLSGGYSKGGKWFRIVTHMDVNDEDVDRAIDAIQTIIIMNK